MKGNLITRLGTASGLVAAIIAAAFALLVQAVNDFDDASARERASRGVALRAAQLEYRVSPAGRVALEQRIRSSEAEASAAEQQAHDAVRRAITISIGGVVGSSLLILVMTTYLTRSIIVPLRRVSSAAADLAEGDLSVRVKEEGDSEPVELARSFNDMAASLQLTQQQLQGQNTELAAQQKQTERALAIKDEFFALVSHELRTPLTSIIGYLEIVRDDEDDLPPDARRFLEVVERNAQRLLRLVGDMLFAAQIEAGSLTLQRGDVDLAAVARESVEAASPAAARGQVRLELDVRPVPPLAGDRERLGQMLDNLVSNALKFTPEGRTVRVSLRDAEDMAVLQIQDEGLGIPASEQHHLFERFFRSSTAVRKAVPGAGLGLTIVKTIAEGHGGTVTLRSIQDVGTIVRVTLPYTGVGPPGPGPGPGSNGHVGGSVNGGSPVLTPGNPPVTPVIHVRALD